MAEPHAHSQPIQTYGPAPHNRNIWPHNSRATVFCLRFWPILLFVPAPASYPLLVKPRKTKHIEVHVTPCPTRGFKPLPQFNGIPLAHFKFFSGMTRGIGAHAHPKR